MNSHRTSSSHHIAGTHSEKTSHEIREVHLRVSGRVQRVRFRLFVREVADDLDLTGWVRNRGQQVEILAQGPLERLRRLIREIHEGPPGANVEGVAQEWSAVGRPARQFRVRWLYVI